MKAAKFSEPLPVQEAEHCAVSMAVALTRASLDDALDRLWHALRSGAYAPVINRAGWLLLYWHHLAEGRRAA